GEGGSREAGCAVERSSRRTAAAAAPLRVVRAGRAAPRGMTTPSAADVLHEARARERAVGLTESAAGYEAAIEAAERAGERAVLAEALRRLAVVRHKSNQSVEARRLCERSFTVARETSNDILAAEALNTLGGIDLEAGPLADARRHFLRAVQLGGASRELRARAEQNLGILASIQGDCEDALACYARSLEAYKSCNDEHGSAIAYHNLGMVSAQRQLLDEADGYFTQSYDIAVRVQDTYLQGLCLLNHAEVYFARERYEEARRNAETALGLFEQVDSGVLRAQAYRIIGMVYRETGRPALLEATYLAVVSEWGQSIESNDSYTFGHCERVATLALAVAQELGLDQHTQTTIRLGAYLHDVGKVRVQHEVLNKPGPLTHTEREA